MIEVINDNIINAKEKYIAHQCNAVTNRAMGVALSLFEKFPYSNIYSLRAFPHKPKSDELPGNIFIKGNGIEDRFIVNMIAQFYPGKPKISNSKIDGYEIRIKYFRECLIKISKIDNLESIAFPYKIGCGLADGDWNKYLEILENFSKYINEKYKATVKLYCHDSK